MRRTNKAIQPEFDYVMLILIAVLIGFGLVMLFSSSYAFAHAYRKDALYYFTRQLRWTLIGIASLLIMLNINYRVWRKWAIPIMGITMLALVGVLLIGSVRFGAQRQFVNGSIQPSEIAKISIIIYIAAWLSSKGKNLRKVSYGLAPFAILLGLMVGLIVIQPDISTSLLITITAVAMFFIAGADLLQMGILALMGGLTFGLVMTQSTHAQERIKVFVTSFADPINSPNFHVREGILALVEGGWFGAGLAESVHKQPGGLPAVHSDSIFAVVGEELGLIGGLIVLALFFFFAVRGTRIALRASDSFGTLLAFGITAWLVLQAFIHIAVITATFPFTGLPLPFFSYGGSSTLANLAAIGILLNISRGGEGGIDLHAYTRLWRRNRRSRVPNSERRRRPRGRRGSVFARSIRRR
ncbi:MAG: cell division protein FtsW [Chloroflexi bacterium]|nr:cell division protein FtsW [Chloroflexota bacterium]